MGRKKKYRTTCSNENYLRQQELSTQQVHVDSHSANLPLTMDSEVTVEDNQGNKSKRGRTLLSHVWNLEPAGLLGQFLETLARSPNLCNLSHKSWTIIKKISGADILCIIKAKFIYTNRCEDWILRSLNTKWCQYKSNLKSMHYVENVSAEELCRNVPEGIPRDQWGSLVCYWKSAESKLAIDKYIQEQPNSAKNSEGRFGWDWKGDTLSQVLGKDPNGRVRAVGLLPTTKKGIETTRHFQGLQMTRLDEKQLVDLVHKLSLGGRSQLIAPTIAHPNWVTL
ncbi:Plant transposase (Ptta/En/Spm family) [Rhynchospora pubera]|uniref:Plant transposase (Ptta/En/Spm family) n=1 Tax=Rhynchospora pubera TaxID=906938 RepID=A0AAV8HD77_9POAL|nr:Plant transposase (Ptta/En/Spm family) [Rhynchospora pubera]